MWGWMGAWRLERNHLIRVQHLAAQYDAMTHFQILPFIQACDITAGV
jgi:hypothetical protein